MRYEFDYGWMSQYAAILLDGVQMTLSLLFVGAVLGLATSVICAWARTLGSPPIRLVVGSYVELVRNTPFLIQLFFIFFGLPQLGLRLHETTAAYLAMAVNLGAYGCEIVRSGIQVTKNGQWEAGASLAMSRNQVFWRVVLVPALQRVWPALVSQVVIVMLGSAVVSQISVQDLTFAANFIQSRNFRAFEVYLVTTVLYLGLAILVRMLLNEAGRRLLGAEVRV